MTVWAETQGLRVNSSVFTWPSIPELPVPGYWLPALPPAPSATQTCSQRQLDLLELWFLNHCPWLWISHAGSSLQQKPRPPWKGLHWWRVKCLGRGPGERVNDLPL